MWRLGPCNSRSHLEQVAWDLASQLRDYLFRRRIGVELAATYQPALNLAQPFVLSNYLFGRSRIGLWSRICGRLLVRHVGLSLHLSRGILRPQRPQNVVLPPPYGVVVLPQNVVPLNWGG